MTPTRKIGRLTALASLIALLGVAGCSSHDERFSDTAPPRAATLENLRSASGKLLTLGEANLLALSPEALTSLTAAATSQYRATGSPASRKLVTTFADALLEAQVEPGGKAGFSSGANAQKADRPTTLAAGIALAGAYEATGNQVYADVARGVAETAQTGPFGWRVVGDQGLMTIASNAKVGSIAQTALAACLFKRAGDVSTADTDAVLRQAVAGVDAEQAAVGRWWADTSGDNRAMTLDQWATTLSGLECSGTKQGQGILGAGVPAMVAGTFDKSGKPLDPERDQVGLPLAIGTVANYPDVMQSGPIVRTMLKHARPNGTIDYSAADDLDQQAAYAKAVAEALYAESVRKGVAKP